MIQVTTEVSDTPIDHPSGGDAAGGFKTEAEGYAASLRQQARWVRECNLDGTIDADELDAAAEFIERGVGTAS